MAPDAPGLDDARTYESLDPARLRERIAGLPEQCRVAWDAAQGIDLGDLREAENVVLVGMGGSGIGNALIEALARERASLPVVAARGYGTPAWTGPRTLVIASSNSGNTEETVAALAQAASVGARCIAVTTGGALLELARARGIPALTFEWKHEQRAALGWSFAAVLALCVRAGVLPDCAKEFDAALAGMGDSVEALRPERAESENDAKQLARRLHGRFGVFVGAGVLAPVAYRWRTQINENAKSWAAWDELPEMNHNAQAGFGLPLRSVPLLHAVFLRSASMHVRVRLRVDATLDAMRSAGVSGEAVDVPGADRLEQVLRAVVLGDYVSYYTGILNGVDPSPVDALVALKERLASE